VILFLFVEMLLVYLRMDLILIDVEGTIYRRNLGIAVSWTTFVVTELPQWCCVHSNGWWPYSAFLYSCALRYNKCLWWNPRGTFGRSRNKMYRNKSVHCASVSCGLPRKLWRFHAVVL